MRVTHEGLTYEIRAYRQCWLLSTVKIRDTMSDPELAGTGPGGEYLSNTVFPGTFPAACRSLLDRMMRDGLSPHAGLTEAVATVAHLYATIGEAK